MALDILLECYVPWVTINSVNLHVKNIKYTAIERKLYCSFNTILCLENEPCQTLFSTLPKSFQPVNRNNVPANGNGELGINRPFMFVASGLLVELPFTQKPHDKVSSGLSTQDNQIMRNSGRRITK